MKKTTFSILLCLLVLTGWAQSNTVTTGGSANGNGGSATYTVGQIAVQTLTDGNISLSEGVQQPFEISTVGIDEYPGISLYAKVFPNPTLGKLTLELSEETAQILFSNSSQLQYRLSDANGKTLKSGNIVSNTSVVDLSDFAPGSYFISISNAKKILKTFKVVKITQ